MKIILFGIGSTTEIVEGKLKKEHEIIGYMDSSARVSIYKGKPFYQLQELQSLAFDYLVIAIRKRLTAWKIYDMIVHEYHIEREKVIPFFIYADSELYRIKMDNCKLENIKGLIFGNSHARDGFLSKYLSIPFLNLSITSQDIYSYLKVWEACMTRYGERLRGLEYVVIDLYDYNVFNIDLSMTTECFHYLQAGGILSEHHFDQNPNYSGKYEDEVFNRLRMIMHKEKWINEAMEAIFNDVTGEIDTIYMQTVNNWKHIEQDEPLTTSKFVGGIVRKHYNNTICENISLLEMLVQSIKTYSSEIKIVCTLIPRYITMEEVLIPFMKDWKLEFEKVIANLEYKYQTYFLNYKDRIEISGNHNFYYDINHLNTIGGICLSSILDEDLKRL